MFLRIAHFICCSCTFKGFSEMSMDKINKWWVLYLLFFTLLVEKFEAFVACEFTYGYETEDFTMAIINLTFIDPVTGKLHSESEEAGKYSVGKVEPVSGLVVHVTSNNHTSHDACDRLDVDNIPHEPWIALIQYGNCRDSTKLRHASNNNATAAVVYSNHPGSRLIKMHHRVFRIVAVFISKEKGEEIASMVGNNTKLLMRILVGTHNSFRYANINRTSVLFVSISFIILMILSLAWLVFYYVQRFRYIHNKDLLAKRLCSAAKKALTKIPVKALKPADLDRDGDLECCAVCIEPFKLGEIVRALPCRHTFHKCCVDPWLLEQRSCPMCKMDILLYYGLVFSDSQDSVLNIEEGDLHLRLGNLEDEIIHVPVHQVSFPSQPAQLSEERATSPCSLSPLNLESDIAESSLFTPSHTSNGVVETNSPVSSDHWEEDQASLSVHWMHQQSTSSSKEPLVPTAESPQGQKGIENISG